MKHHFKLNAISSVVIASLFSLSAIAQETDEVNSNSLENNDEVEIIEVKGFRGSLQKALNAKRFSDSVTDSIHAEDVGKSTDQNIADALSRITGVSVQEEDGEGTRISVRGAGPGQNQISINGIALTGGLTDGASSGGTANNSVDLSSFSADILSSIDVVKTAAADQDEGSLGANVNLRTLRPLSLKKPRRNFTVEGRYNEFADDNDYRANVSFSDKFFDDTFGIIFTASHDTQNTRTDRINTNWEGGTLPISDLDLSRGLRTATDLETGQPIRVLGYQRDGIGDLILDDSGNPILNPIDSLLDYDPATQRLVEGDLNVLARDGVNFSLNTNQRTRTSISTGLQWQPTEKTEIQLDLTHTAQEILEDNQSLNMNISPAVLIHTDDDNTALNVVDLSTNTLVRSTSRDITGGWNRTQGRRDLETNVATLDITHDFTDRLRMNVLAGYSKSTDETPGSSDPERWLSIGTATWGLPLREFVGGLDADSLELVGYDCSQGSLRDCDYFTGSELTQIDAFDGSIVTATSRFNPFDLSTMHLGNINFRQNKMSDENKSLFLNFDYELESDNFTSIEFGAKWSDRVRDVNIQNESITSNLSIDDLSDPDADTTGQRNIFGSVKVADILSGEAFPYDNYAEGIDANRSHPLFAGWAQIDAIRALEIVTNKPQDQVGKRLNSAGSRTISTESIAAYFKANFEFMDGRLTGNLGVRYIKDDNAGSGVGGIKFVPFPQLLDPYDLIVTRNLADVTQAPCPEATVGQDTRYTPTNDDQLRDCWAWQVTHAYNVRNNNTIPIDADGNPVIIGEGGEQGIDVNRILFVDGSGNIVTSNALPALIWDQNGNQVSTSQADWATFQGTGVIWPWLDRSASFTGPLGEAARETREAISSGTNSTEIWLPSLSLNYSLNEETILRFGLSKTMTRPTFDNLNPANNVRENQFNASSGRAGNVLLNNLTSNNIDFSYEWYFDESGLVSVALFAKDMQDFEEVVTVPYHYKDVRDTLVLEDANLLLDFDPNRTPGDADSCMPARAAARFFDRWVIECDVALIDQVRNGAGQTTKGIELSYTQNYEFLPGVFSGLGFSGNYTYQDSARDTQEIGTTGTFSAALPVAYTPQHSANATIFWEKDGMQMRLANRYTGVQVVGETAAGAIWQEASNRLDFSASYNINKNFTLTLNLLNLTDDARRNFLTASNATDFSNSNDLRVTLDEGSVFDGGVTQDRTVSVFQSGRQFRVGIRGNF